MDKKNKDSGSMTQSNRQNLFETMYEIMPSGAILIDENYIIRSVNEQTCKITGYSREELEGEFCDIICPKGSESKQCPIWVDNLQEFQGMDTFVKCRGGFRTPILKNAKRVTIDGNTYILEIFQDISLRKKQQQVLEQSEQEYRTLFETANDAIILFRPEDEKVIIANKKACQLYGYPLEEFIGLSLKDLSTNVTKGEEEISITLAKEKNHHFKTTHKTKDGHLIDLEINASILYHRNELAILSINRDITERKIFEHKLIESETKFRKMYENTLIGIARVDLDFKILEANQAYCNMLGYTKEELIGKSLQDITSPEILEKNLDLQTQLMKGDINQFQLEKQFIHKSGKIIHGILNAIAVYDNNGKTSYFLGNVLDITDRKIAEKKMEELSLRLTLAVSSAKIGIWDLDLINNNLIWDKSMYELYEANPEDFTHDYDAWKRSLHPDDLAYADGKVTEAINNQHDLDIVFRIIKPSGDIAYINAFARLILKNNIATRMVGINYDITEQVNKETTISNNLNEKIILLHEIHHRVKNNMQIIISLLRLQSNTLDDPIAIDAFKSSQNRIRSMSLVHERLYNSHNFSEINLKNYVMTLGQELIQTYSVNPNVLNLQLDISDIAMPIDKAIPCGLIINELITNSLKYAFDEENKKPKIIVKFYFDENNLAVLSYEDNGKGIKDEIDFKTPKTLGLKLITILAKGQLKGDFRYNTENGFGFAIRFKMN